MLLRGVGKSLSDVPEVHRGCREQQRQKQGKPEVRPQYTDERQKNTNSTEVLQCDPKIFKEGW